MKNKKSHLSCNFIKDGIITVMIIAAVFEVFGKSPAYGNEFQEDTIYAPGVIPLNNILTDYLQADKKYGKGLVRLTVGDSSSWNDKRQSIIRRSEIMLGKAPKLNGGTIKPEILSDVQRNGYNELKVQFPSGTGDTIKGYLLVPDDVSPALPRPAILALHSTGPGASQTVGLTPKENRCYGMELAQRGYVVLAIDVVSAGERIYDGYGSYYTDEFYKEFPEWSAMGKNIFDHQRGLDYLCSLDFVDSDRLGCIGHSLGGYNSFFLQAFDPRIKAAVSSCGFAPMGQTNSPYQIARDFWYVHFNPVCRDFIRTGIIPCDMHEIMALCAPRPFFNYSAKQDAVYNLYSPQEGNGFIQWWQTVDEALNQVSRVYQIMGAENNFVRVAKDGGHDFPPDVREAAYKWLDENLGMYQKANSEPFKL